MRSGIKLGAMMALLIISSTLLEGAKSKRLSPVGVGEGASAAPPIRQTAAAIQAPTAGSAAKDEEYPQSYEDFVAKWCAMRAIDSPDDLSEEDFSIKIDQAYNRYLARFSKKAQRIWKKALTELEAIRPDIIELIRRDFLAFLETADAGDHMNLIVPLHGIMYHVVCGFGNNPSRYSKTLKDLAAYEPYIRDRKLRLYLLAGRALFTESDDSMDPGRVKMLLELGPDPMRLFALIENAEVFRDHLELSCNPKRLKALGKNSPENIREYAKLVSTDNFKAAVIMLPKIKREEILRAILSYVPPQQALGFFEAFENQVVQDIFNGMREEYHSDGLIAFIRLSRSQQDIIELATLIEKEKRLRDPDIMNVFILILKAFSEQNSPDPAHRPWDAREVILYYDDILKMFFEILPTFLSSYGGGPQLYSSAKSFKYKIREISAGASEEGGIVVSGSGRSSLGFSNTMGNAFR